MADTRDNLQRRCPKLGGDVSFHYCRTGAEARCFVEEVQFVVPLLVAAVAGTSTILVEHVVDAP